MDTAALDAIADVLLIIGASFALLAAIGVHRFHDTYSRMHAAAKSPTLGLLIAATGAGLRLRSGPAIATLVLVVILQLLSAPVATHILARAVHLRIRVPQDGVDELTRDEQDGPAEMYDNSV